MCVGELNNLPPLAKVHDIISKEDCFYKNHSQNCSNICYHNLADCSQTFPNVMVTFNLKMAQDQWEKLVQQQLCSTILDL